MLASDAPQWRVRDAYRRDVTVVERHDDGSG
jgi:hypothetical protein